MSRRARPSAEVRRRGVRHAHLAARHRRYRPTATVTRSADRPGLVALSSAESLQLLAQSRGRTHRLHRRRPARGDPGQLRRTTTGTSSSARTEASRGCVRKVPQHDRGVRGGRGRPQGPHRAGASSSPDRARSSPIRRRSRRSRRSIWTRGPPAIATSCCRSPPPSSPAIEIARDSAPRRVGGRLAQSPAAMLRSCVRSTGHPSSSPAPHACRLSQPQSADALPQPAAKVHRITDGFGSEAAVAQALAEAQGSPRRGRSGRARLGAGVGDDARRRSCRCPSRPGRTAARRRCPARGGSRGRRSRCCWRPAARWRSWCRPSACRARPNTRCSPPSPKASGCSPRDAAASSGPKASPSTPSPRPLISGCRPDDAKTVTGATTLSTPAFGRSGDPATDLAPLVALIGQPEAHFLTAGTVVADGGIWMGL